MYMYIITFMIVLEYNVKEQVVTSIVKYFFQNTDLCSESYLAYF